MLCCKSNDAVISNKVRVDVHKNRKFGNATAPCDGDDSFSAKDHSNVSAFFTEKEDSSSDLSTPLESESESESRDQSESETIKSETSKKAMNTIIESPFGTTSSTHVAVEDKDESAPSKIREKPASAALVSTISYEDDGISTCFSEATPHPESKTNNNKPISRPQSASSASSRKRAQSESQPTIEEDSILDLTGFVVGDKDNVGAENDMKTALSSKDSADSSTILKNDSNWTEPSWMLQNDPSIKSATGRSEHDTKGNESGNEKKSSIEMSGCLDVVQDKIFGCGWLQNTAN